MTEEEFQHTVTEFSEALATLERPDDVFKAFALLLHESSGGVALGYWTASGDSPGLILRGWTGLGVGQDCPSYVKGLFSPVFGELMAKDSFEVFRREMTDYRSEYTGTWRFLLEYLPGMSAMVVPLMPEDGVLAGVIIAYRKGEQPFLDDDVRLAESVAPIVVSCLDRISGE